MIKTKEDYTQETLHQLSLYFVDACVKDDVEQVNYFLNSQELKERVDIHIREDVGFTNACRHGSLNVVRYLLTSPNLKEHVNIHIQDDIGLNLACHYGHVHLVQYLLSSPDLKDHADIHISDNFPLRVACEKGHLDIVKYLLINSQLREHAYIENLVEKMEWSNDNLHILEYFFNNFDIFDEKRIDIKHVYIKACASGNIKNLEIINNLLKNNKALHIPDFYTGLLQACNEKQLATMKYLLNTPEFKKQIDMRSGDDRLFVCACIGGDVEIISYLLISPDLVENANINAQNGMGLIEVCKNKNIEAVKYLLSSPELKEHANIHIYNDGIIDLFNDNVEMIKFLLEHGAVVTTPMLMKSIAYGNNIIFNCLYQHVINNKQLKNKEMTIKKLFFRYIYYNFSMYTIKIKNIKRLNEILLITASNYGNKEVIETITLLYEIDNNLFKIMKKLAHKDIKQWLSEFSNSKTLHDSLICKLSTSKEIIVKKKVNKI